MKNKRAICVLYAIIAMGIGMWVACNEAVAPSTVPVRETAEPGIVPEVKQTNSHPIGDVSGREAQHGDGHRVWLERANPGSAAQLCEGDSIPALTLRRNDPLGEIHALIYVSDPELGGHAVQGETKHAGEHLPSQEEFEFAAGNLSIALSNLGTIHDCANCSEVRNVLVGITSLHDHDDGSDHVQTYEVGPALTFSVRQDTDAVCSGIAIDSPDTP